MIRIALAALLAAPAAFAAEYHVDPSHASAGFYVKHMMVSKVHGALNIKSGTIEYDEKAPEKTTVEVTIDAASIKTGDDKRDGHLKSPDFFDVAKFPTITFKSTKVESAGEGKLKVTGNLTMHGVTKPITLDVEGPTAAVKSPWGNMVRAVSATGTVNREEFGLSWNKALEAGGVVVGKEVTLDLNAEISPPAPKK